MQHTLVFATRKLGVFNVLGAVIYGDAYVVELSDYRRKRVIETGGSPASLLFD